MTLTYRCVIVKTHRNGTLTICPFTEAIHRFGPLLFRLDASASGYPPTHKPKPTHMRLRNIALILAVTMTAWTAFCTYLTLK